MITLNHSINLVTEVNEKAMPAHLLSVLVNLSEEQLETILRKTFIESLTATGFLDTINENNSWATLKVGEN